MYFYNHKIIVFLYTLESDIRHKHTFDGVVSGLQPTYNLLNRMFLVRLSKFTTLRLVTAHTLIQQTD